MKKVDWYIIKKYLGTFFFVMLMFSAIAVVFDFSEKVQKFIEQPVTASQVIKEYYLNFIPWINGLLFPLYALISVIFITSRMASNSEIISIFSSGASYFRFLRPYLISAGLICVVHLFANHFIIPQGNKTLKDFENTYIYPNNVKDKKRNVHMFIGPETKIYVRYYKKVDSSALDFRIEKFKGNELISLLKAKTIKWLGHPDRWQLKDYEIRSFNGMEEDIILGKGEKLDTSINITPNDFVQYTNQKEMMTSSELREYISVQKSKGLGATKAYVVEIQRRTAEPITIIILSLIGVAVAGRKVRGGIGLHLAMGIGIGAIYIFLSKFSLTFTNNQSISPILGVWIPNILFSIVAWYLLRKAQK